MVDVWIKVLSSELEDTAHIDDWLRENDLRAVFQRETRIKNGLYYTKVRFENEEDAAFAVVRFAADVDSTPYSAISST